MRFYIIDDDAAIVYTFEDIILQKELGEIVGTATDPKVALTEIVDKKPDIVLVDLVMDGLDGIKLVRTIRESVPDVHFVMISKVTDKEIIHRAYDAGVEFFINKPVSIIEMERVINNVSERIWMKGMMNNIKSLFDDPRTIAAAYRGQAVNSARAENDTNTFDVLLSEIGILGESGVKDIKRICRYAQIDGGNFHKAYLQRAAEEEGDSVKNIEQRIRRAIRKGLTNCAWAGLEDIGSDKFTVYANYVYDYTSLKEEMNYVAGKSAKGGRISISRFIEGMLLYQKNM